MATSKKGKAWKRIMGMIYGIGAAIVILGALFKILHLPGANEMLFVGLITEAAIFFISAFEKPHEEPDWTLVYPELAGIDSGNAGASRDGIARGGATNVILKDGVTQELDKLLSDAKIGPELVESLGAGMRNLAEATTKMGELADANVATGEFVTNIKKASTSVETLAENYVKASSSLTNVTISNEDGKSYGEQLSAMSKKLGELNSIYDLQLSGSKEYMDSTKQFYAGINQLMSNLSESVNDTKRYKDEIAQLGNNLEALNTVYGNMLSAMNYKK